MNRDRRGVIMYWVYILENPRGKLYIGHTDDLDRRIEQHNNPQAGSGKYTHKHGPWRLVYQEACQSRSEAVRRERFIKARKSPRWIRDHLLNRRASPDGSRD